MSYPIPEFRQLTEHFKDIRVRFKIPFWAGTLQNKIKDCFIAYPYNVSIIYFSRVRRRNNVNNLPSRDRGARVFNTRVRGRNKIKKVILVSSLDEILFQEMYTTKYELVNARPCK